LDSRAFESRADQVTEAFFSSGGYPVDWEYNYGSEFNSIGLREVGSTSLDANKIARLSQYGLYGISYNSLQHNLSREGDIGFQLHIDSLFDVHANLTLTQPTGTINIETTLGDCTIWAFVVAPNNSVVFTQRAKTDTLGILALTFPLGTGLLPNGYYTLVTFAESQMGVYAIDYSEIIIGTALNYGLKALVQENETSNGVTYMQTTFAGSLTTLSATILYPYLPGGEAQGNESIVRNAPSTNEIFELRMPTNGTTVVLLNGVGFSGSQRRIYVYPMLMNEDFNTIYGNPLVPENEETIRVERLVTIRECIFRAVLYIWAE